MMTPKRSQTVEELYLAARACAGETRDALLATLEPDVRQQVLSLLSQDTLTDYHAPTDVKGDARLNQIAPGAFLRPVPTRGHPGRGRNGSSIPSAGYQAKPTGRAKSYPP